ncbi:unnamed protein product [Paramecium pentaurelia]|uniref:Uncharacterized protein n=1 Tax=Paramecium pentaurelia TaxID=43138 RepID=A0A8S1UQ42_9CILI|nr:unnamed protein product [Paramecium pentaurelia]
MKNTIRFSLRSQIQTIRNNYQFSIIQNYMGIQSNRKKIYLQIQNGDNIQRSRNLNNSIWHICKFIMAFYQFGIKRQYYRNIDQLGNLDSIMFKLYQQFYCQWKKYRLSISLNHQLGQLLYPLVRRIKTGELNQKIDRLRNQGQNYQIQILVKCFGLKIINISEKQKELTFGLDKFQIAVIIKTLKYMRYHL